MGNRTSKANEKEEEGEMPVWIPSTPVEGADGSVTSYKEPDRRPSPSSPPPPSKMTTEIKSKRSEYDELTSTEQRKAGTDGDRQDGVSNVYRTQARPMWWTLVGLLAVVIILVLAAGIRCAVDSDCGLLEAPSLGHFLNNTDTSALAVTGLNALIGMHYMLNVATYHMIKDHSGVAAIIMLLSSIVLYISVFAALLFPEWFIAITPVCASVVWCIVVTHGLRRYNELRPAKHRILFVVSAIILTAYVSSSIIYIVFSAIPLPSWPGKQIGVFVSEITMLLSGLLFVALLVMQTRRVKYIFQVERTTDSYTRV